MALPFHTFDVHVPSERGQPVLHLLCHRWRQVLPDEAGLGLDLLEVVLGDDLEKLQVFVTFLAARGPLYSKC